MGPCWEIERKKGVLNLAFANRLALIRDEDFRTPDFALSFKVLAEMGSFKNRLIAESCGPNRALVVAPGPEYLP